MKCIDCGREASHWLCQPCLRNREGVLPQPKGGGHHWRKRPKHCVEAKDTRTGDPGPWYENAVKCLEI